MSPTIKQSMPVKPQPGDHIYSKRLGGLYIHHGIYVGNDRVIHLTGPAKQSASSHEWQKCGYKPDRKGRVVISCLDGFLDGHSLRIYEYGVPNSVYRKKRRGTCSTSNSKPADEVIQTANDLLQRGDVGNYNVFSNNCEDFAVYCKTGSASGQQVIGHVKNVVAVLMGGGIAGIIAAAPVPAAGIIAAVAVPAAYAIGRRVT